MEHLKLIRWFEETKRSFPWRENIDPYRVWISEVMLQQTQAATVIDYFERWMRKFPTLSALAKATHEEVIKAWEGLGYYSRARNIHSAAKIIDEKHLSKFPDRYDDILNIKGIGPYTAAAIASFAYHQKKAPVDGNVSRVLSRYHNLTWDIAKAATQNKIRQLAEDLLPDTSHWVYSEALIELGAKVCKKKPLCFECPLKLTCKARINGNEESLPINSKKITYEKLFRNVALIICNSRVIIEKNIDKGLMQDLFEFPYFNTEAFCENLEDVTRQFEDKFSITLQIKKILNTQQQSFTRFKVFLRPFIFFTNEIPCQFFSLPIASLNDYPFSSGHRRIIKEFSCE